MSRGGRVERCLVSIFLKQAILRIVVVILSQGVCGIKQEVVIILSTGFKRASQRRSDREMREWTSFH